MDEGLLDEAYRLVLRTAQDGLEVARAGVWLLLEDRSGIRCGLLVDRANETDLERLVLTRGQFPRYFAALDDERAILANDACSDPRTAEFADSYLRPLGIGAMLDVPIRHRGEMVGIICCEHIGGVRGWTGEEATFAACLADLVGRAITASRQAEAERALRALNATLEARVVERTRALEAALATATVARQEAEVANAAKTRFLATMSHELRTPLNAILGYTDLLVEDVPELEAIRGAAGHLLAMIEDMLDVARIEAGALEVEARAVAVDPALDEVEATMRPVIERTGNHLAVERGSGAAVLGDARAIRQILLNLLGNAAKFSEAGAIVVRARSDGEGWVALEVADSGPGIAQGDLGRVFEPFFQADSSPTRRHGGVGLGLSICRSLAAAMGGEIAVESALGTGSTFRLRLPRAPARS